ELKDIRAKGKAGILHDIEVDQSSILNWTGLILPENPPYQKGAFKIDIVFPAEYPFKPPKYCFVPVIQALVGLIQEPEPEHPLRADVAEEYCKDRKKFMKSAEEWTKKYAEKRTT
ncbi:hypothetical protein QZH41_018998, partial [Actinostola sp. cb2023]